MQTTTHILELLRTYKEQNATKYGIERIGVFGSVARNEQSEGSDVDIFYIGKPVGLFVLSHIKQELEKLFHSPVDIVRLQEQMNYRLLNRIQKEGIYV